MELSWLQDLNLLLGRTVIVVSQASAWPARMAKEVKYTLICLANRRKRCGGRFEVTNEHLTRTMHYFDIRNLIHDANQADSDNPTNATNGFTRHWWFYESSDDESDTTPQSSESQHGASSPTKKRKTSDSPASTSQSGKT